MRKELYAANWKMHKTAAETKEFLVDFLAAVNTKEKDVLIAPPYTSISVAADQCAGSGVIISAQNCHYETSGAYTGELTTAMISEAGAQAVIIGHSERRHVFGEDDELINKKTLKATGDGLLTILCVGELLEEREAQETENVIKRQLEKGLKGIAVADAGKVVIAYEPVWAIGTGKTATPETAQSAHAFIREILSALYDATLAAEIRILYGGSVKPGNISDLMAEDDIDGVLVGGASLDADSFAAIVNHTN